MGSRLVDALTMAVMCETVGNVSAVEKPALTAPAPGEIYAFSTLFPMHDDNVANPITAYAASADPDTMYYHEAMREPDAPEFRNACVQEFVDQWDNGNFVLKPKAEIPEDARILPSVCCSQDSKPAKQ